MMQARGDLFVPVDLRRLETHEFEVHRMHGDILQAIKDKDPEAAAEAMRKHLDVIRSLTSKALAAAGLQPAGR